MWTRTSDVWPSSKTLRSRADWEPLESLYNWSLWSLCSSENPSWSRSVLQCFLRSCEPVIRHLSRTHDLIKEASNRSDHQQSMTAAARKSHQPMGTVVFRWVCVCINIFNGLTNMVTDCLWKQPVWFLLHWNKVEKSKCLEGYFATVGGSREMWSYDSSSSSSSCGISCANGFSVGEPGGPRDKAQTRTRDTHAHILQT